MNPLCITISSLWISVLYIWTYSHTILVLLLISTIASSYWFWSNPIRNSLAHTIDALVAKLCIGTFIVHTFSILDMIELRLMYAIVLSYIAIMCWKSNYESTKEWCSWAHIQSHMFLHFFCFVATFFCSRGAAGYAVKKALP
jgi:hypothetical protein